LRIDICFSNYRNFDFLPSIQHKDHPLERLSQVYNTHTDRLKKEIAGVNQRLADLRAIEEKIDDNVRLVKTSKEER